MFAGGVLLWVQDVSHNPFFVVAAWGLIVALVGGLLLMGVGYVLREVSEEQAPDLASRIQNLEAEVARLRARSESPSEGDQNPPPSTGFREPPGYPK